MTADKAIDLLHIGLKHTYVLRSHDLQDAMKLGIEALEQIKAIRACFPTFMPSPLPGEDPQ